MTNPLEFRADGNFYIRYRCSRCGDVFYHWACQNMTMQECALAEQGISYCDWCAGKCSAAEQSYVTEAVNAAIVSASC